MSANILTVRGFVNKIDRVPGKNEGDDPKYFAKVAYSHGDGKNRQTQYLSCYVSKSLHRLVHTSYETQTKIGDRVVNVLGSQLADLTIINPYFKINDAGYLESSGILSAISFETPEPTPNTSK